MRPAGASGPRVRLRTEAGGASLWCFGAAPAPALPRGSSAAGRTEAARAGPASTAVRGSSSGKQKVLLSGVGQGPRRVRRAPIPPPPTPTPRRAAGIPHCSGLGRALGVTVTPAPHPRRRAGTCSICRASHSCS